MMLLAYPFMACASVAFTILAYLLALVLPMFTNNSYNLPRWLRWFQTPDNPICGDAAWGSACFGLSMYERCLFWLWRNPGQGFDAMLGASRLDLSAMPTTYGNFNVSEGAGVGGWRLHTCCGYFHLYIIVPLGSMCIHSEFGWRLGGMVMGHASEICRQFVFTPFRFVKFGK